MWFESSHYKVKEKLGPGKTMIFDAVANCKNVLDQMMDDGNDFLTRKKLNMFDDKLFDTFSEDTWQCIDKEQGEYCLKKIFFSRINYYFHSQVLYDPNMAARRKKADKQYREAVQLQGDRVIEIQVVRSQDSSSFISCDETTEFLQQSSDSAHRDEGYRKIKTIARFKIFRYSGYYFLFLFRAVVYKIQIFIAFDIMESGTNSKDLSCIRFKATGVYINLPDI